MKKTIITIVASSAALVAVFSGEPSADASDGKTFHATSCQATDGKNDDYNRSEYRLTRTGSASNGTVICPVDRDSFECGGVFGGCIPGATLTASVLDNHFTADINCTFSARSTDGAAGSWASAKTTAAPAIRQDLAMSIAWPSGLGSYALVCSLPSISGANYVRFFSYHVSESD